MIYILKKLMYSKKSTSFAKDVLKLASGTTIAQGLMVMASPILARLYAPEDFGVLALYISITSIVSVIACMRYELAIMLPEEDSTAANLLGLSICFTFIISGLAFVILYFFKKQLLSLLNAPSLEPYLWIIPITIMLDGLFLALNYWNSRKKQFGRLSIARVSSSFATLSTQLTAGYADYASGGALIGANVVGKTISTLVLSFKIVKEDTKYFFNTLRLKYVFREMIRYRKFPLYDSWSALLNTISWQIPIFFLVFIFDEKVLGYYAFSMKIIQLPASLVGASISQVFYQKGAEDKNHLREFVVNIFYFLLAMGIIPFGILILNGRFIFEIVFGTSWSISGFYAQPLSVFAYVMFLSSPLSILSCILEVQDKVFYFSLANLLGRLFVFVIGGMSGNSYLCIFLFSFVGVMQYIIFLWWLLRKVQVKLMSLFIIVVKDNIYIIALIFFINTIAIDEFFLFILNIFCLSILALLLLKKHYFLNKPKF